jgi:hypothetical protein
VIQLVAAARVVLMLLLARYIDALALFPLAFASLVLQKGYVVSKSALVPSTVRSDRELVEANSKLGLIAGLTGAAAVVPAGLLLQVGGASATLVYGALIFCAAFVAATRLAPDVVADRGPDEEEEEELGSTPPQLRTRMREETMLSIALAGSAVAGLLTAVMGGPVAGILLAAVVNLAAAVGRLGFESVVQRDAPDANQGRAFARFETRFQLSWAVAAFVAVAIQAPGAIGFLLVGLASAGTLVQLRARSRRTDRARSRSPGRARDPARRSRWASEQTPDR